MYLDTVKHNTHVHSVVSLVVCMEPGVSAHYTYVYVRYSALSMNSDSVGIHGLSPLLVKL